MLNRYEQIVEAMNRRDLRITEQRKSIASIFARINKYLSAKEIYLKLLPAHPDISYDTVYRNLRLLLELGILEQIYMQDGARFKACFNRLGKVERQLICLTCAQVTVEEGSPILAAMPAGFETISVKVYGYCSTCGTE